MATPSGAVREDVDAAKRLLRSLPTRWEGKDCVLKLKKADYNWRQTEWWAFYFEFLCRESLLKEFQIPGERIGTTTFDARRSVNWDFKGKAIRADDHHAILNDTSAMQTSIAKHGAHGMILALCDVEYNDVSRSFQRWHTRLKGGLSGYERDRIARTSISRYRKTRAVLAEILFLQITHRDLALLGTMRQGRNSNGRPRPEKYMLDLERVGPLLVDRLTPPGGWRVRQDVESGGGADDRAV
ncbi:MAG: hypothetical protein HY608_08820 [Planctomycetes bacterium]|nr:hypothetical protein [Planctomycetota bacterium]